MVRLHRYEDLAKKPESLLSKNYIFGATNLNLLVSKGAFLTSFKSTVQKQNISGSAKISCSGDHFSFTHKRNTQQLSTYNLTVIPPLLSKQLKIISNCKVSRNTDQFVESLLDFEYTYQEKLAAKLGYCFQSGVLSANLCGKFEEVVAGAEVKVCKGFSAIEEASATFAWHPKTMNLVFRYETAGLGLGKMLVYLNQKIGENLKIGSKIVANFKSASNTILVGCLYKIDENSEVRAKICDLGDLGFGLTRKLTPQLEASLAAGFNIQDLISHSVHSQKLGVRFSYSNN